MMGIFVGIVLSLVLLIPPAVKWELRMSWVAPWAVGAGAVIGFLASRVLPFRPISWEGIALQAVAILGLSALVLAWRFFRDPERRSPSQDGVILSPADGIILYVTPFERGETAGGKKGKGCYSLRDFTQSQYFPGGGTVIGIGMSFLDVHVNRAPVSGQVEEVRRIPGRFLSLKRPEALTLNERALTVFRTADGHAVGMVQIASRLVRCIVSYVKKGDVVTAGQRVGMIKFGSQVDLILPAELSARIRCAVGQQVYAGLTVLADRSGAD